MTERHQGLAAVAAGSMFLGSVGIFVRFADASLEPMMQSFGRIFVAFVLITLLNVSRTSLRTDAFGIKRSDIPFFVLNGLVGFSVMASAFTLAVLYTNISNAYFLLYTAPVFAALFGAAFLGEKITRQIVISIVIGIMGLVFLFNPDNLANNMVGNLFGLVTGVSFGAYFVVTGYLGKSYSSSTITFWTQLFGALGLFPLIFVFDDAVSLGSGLAAWLPVIGAGTVVLIGYYLLNFGLTKIKSSVGSILSLFEPLSAIVYGLVFFAEYPTAPTFVGAGLIILSIAYLTRSQARVK